MKNLYKLLPVMVVICLIISSCSSSTSKTSSQSSESSLSADIKIDSLYPPGLEELQFNSAGDTIYGLQYLANGRGPHPTVVLLHGLPGNEKNLDIAQHLRRKGYNVIYFNYRGSWGSQGEFSFANCIDDVKAVLSHITDSANRKQLRVDSKNIFLLGHSMGAGLALISGINDDRVKGIIGISVFNPYSIFQGRAAQVNLVDIGTYVSKLGMLNTTPPQFINGLLNQIELYNIEELIAQTKKPVLVIDEHELNSYFKTYAKRKNVDYEVWNTDHSFTDKRWALTEKTEKWLNSRTMRR